MTDSRKRQKGPQGQPIHVQVATSSTSTTPSPALALFPSAQPPSKTPYSLYQDDTQTHSLLAAETSEIEFESRNHLGSSASEDVGAGGEDKGYSTEYMLGVHNPRTNTLTLHSTPLHLFTPSIKSLKPSPESLASRDHQSLMTQQRALLGSTFGTKKAIRQLNSQQRNKLNQESFGTGQTIKILQTHLQSSIEQASSHLPSLETLEQTANLAKPIPKPNFSAQTPEQVYSLDDLISPSELNSIDLSPFLSAQGNKERLALLPGGGRKPQFLWTKFKQILPLRNEVEGSLPNPSKKDRQRLKLVIHSSYLFAFRQIVVPGKIVDKSKLIEKLGKPPPVVIDSLLERYTEPIRGGTSSDGGEQRKVTSFMELKLLSYLLVLVLRIDGYSTDVDSIAQDLGMGRQKVGELFRSLGCQLVVPTATDREKLVQTGMASTVAEAAKMKKASLKVPLEFPKERKGRAKK
ncbi:hypothetical protein JCM5350_000135 [Sporobolomyces pararoseus]